MIWKIEWDERSLKDMASLDRRRRKRIVEAIERLAGSGAGDVKRLKGSDEPVYRLRVGDWRVLFVYVQQGGEHVLRVRAVRSRQSAYR